MQVAGRCSHHRGEICALGWRGEASFEQALRLQYNFFLKRLATEVKSVFLVDQFLSCTKGGETFCVSNNIEFVCLEWDTQFAT